MTKVLMSTYAWEFKVIPSARGYKVMYRRQEQHRVLGDQWHKLFPQRPNERMTEAQAFQALCVHLNGRTTRRQQ